MTSIKPLSEENAESLAPVFNEAFSDYLVKVRATPESLAVKMKQESIDPSWSAGAYHEGRLVGFILHGCRSTPSGKWLYNAGTGVIPSARGQKLTEQMYRYILPLAQQEGISRFVLEVIIENTRALNIYQKIGFDIERTLCCFSGAKPSQAISESSFLVKPLSSLPEVPQSWRDSEPSWPAATASLKQVEESLLMAGAYDGERLVGYIAALASMGRLLQLAVDPAYRRRKIASALVSHCFGVKGYESMLALNVDEQDQGSCAFFESIGWKPAVRQYEMERRLKAEGER
ncbi:MAG TPA: GNAT family N-acetyltransferase [Flavisolibacter sp.]|jgi:ribosomal protein S18 acetylase RimI-like enzyme